MKTFCAPIIKLLIIMGMFSITGFVIRADEINPTYECQVEPRDGENFSFVAAECWIPSRVQILNGIMCVVLLSSCKEGMILKDPQPWKKLATASGCALVTVSIGEATDNSTKVWSRAGLGSGRGLLMALDTLAKQSGHPEMQNTPIVIAGVCAAGQFAYEFAAFAPKRTRAFVTIGGGMHDISLVPKNASVNGLLVVCLDRYSGKAKENLFDVFEEGCRNNARWGITVEKIGDYDDGKSSTLVIDYLAANLDLLRMERSTGSTFANTTHAIGNMAEIWKSLLPDVSFSFDALKAMPCQLISESLFASWHADSRYNDVSFVGSTIQTPLIVSSELIDIGVSHRLRDGSCNIRAGLEVSSSDDRIDSVWVDSYLRMKTSVLRKSPSRWTISCDIDVTLLPSGSFLINLPIRCSMHDRELLGGKQVLIIGKIVGNVEANIATINFGQLRLGEPNTRIIHVKSSDGAPINLISISNTLGTWAQAHFNLENGSDAEIELELLPPNQAIERTFSGYFIIHVKTKSEEKVKISAFGCFPDRAPSTLPIGDVKSEEYSR